MHFARVLQGPAACGLMVLLASCSHGTKGVDLSDAGAGAGCTPGERRSCACAQGPVGVHICEPNGMTFAACLGCVSAASSSASGSSVSSTSLASSQTVTLDAGPGDAGPGDAGSPNDVLLIPRTPLSITIDGVPEPAWDGVINQDITHAVIGTPTPSDLSGRFGLMWDTQNLYAFIHITDRTLRTNSPITELWLDDAVELFLDLGANGGTAPDQDDAHFIVREGDLAYARYATDAGPGSISVASVAVDGGRTLEMAIPWAWMPPLSGPGGLMGFDVALDDDDTADLEGMMFWHSLASNASDDPSVLGRARLSGCTPVAPSPGAAQLFYPTGPITVDGALESAWDGQLVYPVATQVLGASTPNPTSMSAVFGMLRDDVALYVMVEVHDDVRQNDSPTAVFNDDAVEIYLDLNGSGGQSPNAQDFHYLVRAQDGALTEVWHNAVAGVQVATVDLPTGGYRVEMAIPLSTVGQPGPIMGLDVAVDDDDDGGGRDTMTTWSSTSAMLAASPLWFGHASWGNCLAQP